MTEQENKPVTLWTNDAHLSDRDQFAIGFAEWKIESYERFSSNKYLGRNNIGDYVFYSLKELLELYKQSLTETDKK